MPSGSAPDLTTFVPPAFDTHPGAAYTLGPEVADLNGLAGYMPDVHERLILDRLFAYKADDTLASPEACIIGPRQNFKSATLKMAVLGWLYLTDAELISWSSHELKNSKEMHRDLSALIRSCPPLKKRLKKTRNEGITEANGAIGIELEATSEHPRGQRVLFNARTLDGGRGMSGDRVVLDEAFALAPDHLGALMPTLSSRRDPQVVYASSAGKSGSAVLRDVRDRGRSGKSKLLTYLEWCSRKGPDDCRSRECQHVAKGKPGHKPGCVMDDPEQLRFANPSTAVYRDGPTGPQPGLNPSILAMERESMDPAEYGRERLGWWDEPVDGESIFPAGTWENGRSEPGELAQGMAQDARVALDVSPARTWACLCAAAPLGGDLFGVELTGDRASADYREGTGWVVARLVSMKNRRPRLEVWILAGSAAESMKPAIEAAGVPVQVIAGRDIRPACGLFYDMVLSGKLRHLGQPNLTAALAQARMRESQDGFSWERRKSAGDITPLYAATAALWAARMAPDPEPKFFSWSEL